VEWLEITQTNIASLAGIETLEDLRYFHLSNAGKLRTLEALGAETIDLRELDIQTAKKIESYQPLGTLRRLRRLKLSSCAPMPNLSWVAGMNWLDSFSFVETNVEDGNLSPLLELSKLRYVGTMDKRHYNLKFDAINEMLNSKEEF